MMPSRGPNLFRTMRTYIFKWKIVLVMCALITSFPENSLCASGSKSSSCAFGRIVTGIGCVCSPGFVGPNCSLCAGRTRLTSREGFISHGVGNYPPMLSCSWLIQSGIPNTTVWLFVEHLSIECVWDSLYIFDGDSVLSPLLGSLSGLVTPTLSDISVSAHAVTEASKLNSSLLKESGSSTFSSNESIVSMETVSDIMKDQPRPAFQLHSTSGSLFIYFASDKSYEASGFNISYRFNSCPGKRTCSDHGSCSEQSTCVCDVGWTGVDCALPLCFSDVCEANDGTCSNSTGLCECPPGRTGINCSELFADAHWTTVPTDASSELNWARQGRASHSMVVYKSSFFVYGGFPLNHARFQGFEHLLHFEPHSRQWTTLDVIGSVPSLRYDHTAVVYQGKMYVYGGVVGGRGLPTNELWVLSLQNIISPRQWQQLELSNVSVAVRGHSATVVNNTMVVLFGMSLDPVLPVKVQEYNFDTGTWAIVETTGDLLYGRTGHVAVYHETLQQIFIHGGFETREFNPSRNIVVYSPVLRQWSVFSSSNNGPASFLHSAVLVPPVDVSGLLLTFGGCQHNNSVDYRGSSCHSDELWAFDLYCRRWTQLPSPHLFGSAARFGHSAVIFDGSMWLFGGFNGQMLTDVLHYKFANCSVRTSEDTCLDDGAHVVCAWLTESSSCVRTSSTLQSETMWTRNGCDVDACEPLSSCAACSASEDCRWHADHNYCTSSSSNTSLHQPTNCSQPVVSKNDALKLLRTCDVCQAHGFHWKKDRCVERTGNVSVQPCNEVHCLASSSCSTCFANSRCLWCPSTGTCVYDSLFLPTFAYSQCIRWFDLSDKNRGVCPDNLCSLYKNCSTCEKAPGCGWCEDALKSGLGQCHLGSSTGPVMDDGDFFGLGQPANTPVPYTACPAGRWYYNGQCPACQCNGHSSCGNGSTCEKCQHFTEGAHCETCKITYYGRPANNGTCYPCACNDHGTVCNRRTGVCTCTSYGTTGDHCEKCTHGYEGNSTNGGHCFLRLLDGLSNLIRVASVTSAYFLVRPSQDKTLELTFATHRSVSFRLTYQNEGNPNGREVLVDKRERTTSFSTTFSSSKYNFDERQVLRIYIANFTTAPLLVTISLVYKNELDLLLVFLTFFGCFLSLLSVACIGWYIKNLVSVRYSRRVRQQQLHVMAARPFVHLTVVMDTVDQLKGCQLSSKEVSPIAIHPLAGEQKVALASFLIRLPGDKNALPAHGKPGLALASTVLSTVKHKAFQESHEKRRKQFSGIRRRLALWRN